MRFDPETWASPFARSRRPVITQRKTSAKFGRSQFAAWLRAASPNDRFIYHVGDLQADRLTYGQLNWMGLDAYQAYSRGQVILMQHRRGPFRYEYIAIRTAS